MSRCDAQNKLQLSRYLLTWQQFDVHYLNTPLNDAQSIYIARSIYRGAFYIDRSASIANSALVIHSLDWKPNLLGDNYNNGPADFKPIPTYDLSREDRGYTSHRG